jgi:hypothetical protein
MNGDSVSAIGTAAYIRFALYDATIGTAIAFRRNMKGNEANKKDLFS